MPSKPPCKNPPSQQVNLRPFRVPGCAIVDDDRDALSQAPLVPLGQIDAQVLSQLCDMFRAEVFAKAGKQDPTI